MLLFYIHTYISRDFYIMFTQQERIHKKKKKRKKIKRKNLIVKGLNLSSRVKRSDPMH